ncbi:MAG: enoyl-CoA hydratase-related protein [Nitriliruptor sp.]|uniref:enoyl-CoA hydratase-related protein n=1 Tax=Nitriliruptor sp. TaxID=2448056 RepID=UPI00349FD5A3
MTDGLRSEVDGGVLTLTLDRPQRRNALTGAVLDAFVAALGDLERDVRVVVLTGEGKGFCAGQDLADEAVAAEGADLGATVDRWNAGVRAVRDARVPVIAAVNGVAAGAGANLALACDLVVAARSARFLEPFAGLGLVPDGGGTWTLPRLVGPQRAAAMTLLGAPLDATTAADWGLIAEVADDDTFGTRVAEIAATIAGLPPEGVAETKRLLRATFDHDLDAQLDLERDVQRERGAGQEYRSALAAFLSR